MTTRTSMWLSRESRPSRSPLTSDLDVELVVVGAGWAGLHAALLAQRGGADVAIVEAGLVGTGTTGYSTAKLTSQHSLIYAELVRRHGSEVAGQYAAAQLAGIEVVTNLVDELGIDCDLTEAPAIAYTLDDDRRGDIENEAAAAATLGLPARLVETAGLPFDVAAAVSFDRQYHLDPVRYLDGLADAFVANGGRIFEHTRVRSVDEQRDHRVRLSTEHASVHVNQAIVATLLPIGLLGGYFARTRPIGTYGLAVRLRQEAPAAMTIAVDSPSWSTRPWPAVGPNGLLILGNGHEVGEAGRTADRQQELENWAHSTFEIETVEHRWFAHDYSTPDLLPYVGPTPTSRSILVATGFAKWGLSNGAAAAIILADQLAGRDNGWAAAFDATRIGDVQAVGKLVKDNLQVGKEFVTRFGSKGPKCTHLGCPLHWNAADSSWDCNCHGSRFDATGSVLTGLATKPLDLGKSDD